MLLIAADHLQQTAALPGNAVVATVMSNIGLELALRERGIELVRAPVGDKYVMEEMQKRGLALGGEQSGHVIFADHLFTGDGIGTALQVLRIMAATGRELDELAGGAGHLSAGARQRARARARGLHADPGDRRSDRASREATRTVRDDC